MLRLAQSPGFVRGMVLAAAVSLTCGCASTGSTGSTGSSRGTSDTSRQMVKRKPRQTFSTRSVSRTTDRSYINGPGFGAPRGRQFEDLVPIGARISAVHTAVADGTIQAVWLSYKLNDQTRQTQRRGSTTGRVETFTLKRDEKIIGIHGYGRSLAALAIATNKRTHIFGSQAAVQASRGTAWFDELSKQQTRQYVAVGISGRADSRLRQLSLRIQVQE